MSKRGASRGRLIAAAAVLILGVLAQRAGIDLSALTGGLLPGSESTRGEVPADAPLGHPQPLSPRVGADPNAVARIEAAAAQRESGFMVTVDATVDRTLSDDNDGSRHQRFLIELSNGQTLLVAHNIDLADRVPVRRGDRIRVRGQYEWNERGGVLHWTHHDPAGRHPGGWIEFEGRRTQ